MTITESTTRARATLDEVLQLEALQWRHLIEALESGLTTDQAESVIAESLLEYARWRGKRAREFHQAAGVYLHAQDILRRWPEAELLGPLAFDLGVASGSAAVAEFETSWLPHIAYLLDAGRRDLADRYYQTVFPALFEAYHPGISCVAELAPDGRSARLRIAIAGISDPTPLRDIATEVLDHPSALRSMIRRQVQNRSAGYALVAKTAIRRHDATGEMCVRDGLRRYATERGTGQRERHLSLGLEPSLKTLMENFDVPTEDAWSWRDEGYLSEGTWFQDCTFCPHIPVWKELDALALGRMYDVEVHHWQFRAYHPDIQVQWGKLQTRGDDECQFRFILPSKRASGDPEFHR